MATECVEIIVEPDEFRNYRFEQDATGGHKYLKKRLNLGRRNISLWFPVESTGDVQTEGTLFYLMEKPVSELHSNIDLKRFGSKKHDNVQWFYICLKVVHHR